MISREGDEESVRASAPVLRNLEEMSIQALTEYLAELDSEMERVRQMIEAKRHARTGADAIFKQKG